MQNKKNEVQKNFENAIKGLEDGLLDIDDEGRYGWLLDHMRTIKEYLFGWRFNCPHENCQGRIKIDYTPHGSIKISSKGTNKADSILNGDYNECPCRECNYEADPRQCWKSCNGTGTCDKCNRIICADGEDGIGGVDENGCRASYTCEKCSINLCGPCFRFHQEQEQKCLTSSSFSSLVTEIGDDDDDGDDRKMQE